MNTQPRKIVFHVISWGKPLLLSFAGILIAAVLSLGLPGIGAPQALASAPTDSPGAVIVVDSLGDLPDANPSDGICETDASTCTLRAAIETAQGGPLVGGDTIDLTGLVGTIFLSSGPLPDIVEDLAIDGPGLDGALQINATGEFQHFDIGSGVTVEITGLELSNGLGGTGGSISNAGTLTLSGVLITESFGSLGGGLYGAPGSTTTIRDHSYIGLLEHGNSATLGGGVYADLSTVYVDDSYIGYNGASDRGGGIYNASGSVYLENHTVVEGNSTTGNGGGIYNTASALLEVTDSTLYANQADGSGGGIYNFYSTQILTNATISGNLAKGDGGGIVEESTDSAQLYNVTITANVADSDANNEGEGGGVYVTGFFSISNSIIAGNEDRSSALTAVFPDCAIGIVIYNPVNTNNVIGNNAGCTDVFVNGVSGNLVGSAASPLDPVLGPLTWDSSGALLHALLAGSPAIDAGDPTGCKDDLGAVLPTDQRGVDRPQNVVCDIGAYEAAWPVIDDQDFEVMEGSPDGTVVGTVMATDPNCGCTLDFAITGGNGTGSGAFALGASNGQLTVADSSQLNYTVNPSFALSVEVTNTIGLTDTAIVTVDLLPSPLVVRNSNDSGPGSLRAAMLYAESNSGFDTITFDIPGAGPHVITPTSPLPNLFDLTTIDGSTQPAGEVVIDGSLAGPLTDGFVTYNYATRIRSLTITNFGGSGVNFANTFEGAEHGGFLNLVENSTITGNGGNGISLDPTQYATIRANDIYSNALLGIDLDLDGVTPNDVGDPDGGANLLQNYPVLLRAVPGEGNLDIEGRLNSLASTSYTLEFFASKTCDPTNYGEGEQYLGALSVDTDAKGNARFDAFMPAPPADKIFITATATDPYGRTSEFSQCIVVSPGNDVWPRALRLEPTAEGTILTATASQYLDLRDQSRWYKFHIEPGSKVKVTLENLPANYDLTLYKDIQAAYDKLATPADNKDLNQLNAEFAPDAWSPDAWSPDAWSPDAWSPDAWSPDAWSPDAWSPDAWSPDAWSPDTYSPDAWSPDAWSPDPAYSSAQLRSLLAVSGLDGTADERAVADTWNNTGDFYVRVRGRNGAFSLAAPFTVNITLETDVCEDLDTTLVPTSLNPVAGNYRTLIVTDLARTPGSPAAIAQLQAKLAQLTARGEVQGVVVDVGADARVAAANAQADVRYECPPAKNLVADSIKTIIDRYRSVNPLEYVVLVGGDSVIPFFRHPDQALLADEANYVPPVKNATASQASLRLSYTLSQDRYGSSNDMTYKSFVLPIPGLAVGRLVETPTDMIGMIDAYLSTAGGVVNTPTTSMVSGYDFLTDAAEGVKTELEAGIGAPAQALIAPRSALPTDPQSWNADQLRALLLGSRHDLVFLAGHFSASTALAADFQTRLLSTDVTSSTVDMVNSIVFSAGCHSGYNIVNQDGIPHVTREPDWAQAFARKQATLIAGTGYQYGDTDFIEYSERLYLEFSRQLRLGFGPVSVGKALAAAKTDYLANTPEMRGIHEKAFLEATLFGLPMLSVDMPTGRGNPPADPPIVTGTSGFPTDPGHTLGLEFADVTVVPDLTVHQVVLTSTTGVSTTATYLSGSDGVVSNPGELVYPVEFPNVTVAGNVLRGVGLRGGMYNDMLDIVPLTAAPVTELRGIHAPFRPGIFYPVLPWQANYFDALAHPSSGLTRLAVLPAQFKTNSATAVDGTLRFFDNLEFRLYYSSYLSNPDQVTTTYPSVAAPPTISEVSSITETNQISFTVTVIGDPSVGVQEVWVLYTAAAGDLYRHWQALDLTQDATDSRLWKGALALTGTLPQDVRFMVQAVNGVGLVGTATNMGAYFIGGVNPGAIPPNASSTSVSLLAPPSTGPYATELTFTAQLDTPGTLAGKGSSAPSTPVAGQMLTFALGGQQRTVVTGADGRASASLPLMAPPGPNQVRVSFAGSADYLQSSTTTPFTIVKQPTQLSISPQPAQGQYSDVVDLSALLTDRLNRPLTQKTVLLVADNGSGFAAVSSITNYVGQTVPEPVSLPAGLYSLTAYFMGTIPVGGGATLELDDTLYAASRKTGTLAIIPENATVAYTGDISGYENQPLHAAAQVTQENDGSPGNLALAKVRYVMTDASSQVVATVVGDVAPDGASQVDITGLISGTYQMTVEVMGGYFTSPVSAPVGISIGAPTAVGLSSFAAQAPARAATIETVAALVFVLSLLLVAALKRKTARLR